MKILVISNMYPSKKSISFGVFVKNQVEALRKKGFIVDVLAVKNPNSSKFQVIFKYIQWLLKSSLFLALKGKKFNVIHVHYVFPSGLIGLMFKRFNPSVKLIVTAHGGDINKMAKKNPRIRKWTEKVLSEADHVIAVGQELSMELHQSYDVPLDKLSIVSMGVNRTVFKPYDKIVVRQDLEVNDEAISILFVGNVIKEKGLIELLGAYRKIKKEIPNARLDIVGKIKSEFFFDELKSYINTYSLTDIYFHGAHNQTEVAKWMSAANVFVLPSYMEGFGLVAVEAMACKTPVVGSDVGGLSYLLNNECGILIEPQSEKSLYEGISQILNDSNLASKIVENAEAKVEENDEETIIEELIQVYQEQ